MKLETLLEEIKDTATEGSELDDKLEECTECLETMIGHTRLQSGEGGGFAGGTGEKITGSWGCMDCKSGSGGRAIGPRFLTSLRCCPLMGWLRLARPAR